MEYDPLKYSRTSFDSNGPAEELIQILLKNLQDMDPTSQLTILDLGCGPGNSALTLAKHFPNATIYGLDVNPQMIEYTKKIKHNERLHFFVQDLNLPFEKWDDQLKQELLSHPIDIVFSNYSLQWLDDPRAICAAIGKILKPNTGIFCSNILYSEIYSVIDSDEERELIQKYMNYPDHRKFITDWLFALKDDGKFPSMWFKYWEPCSIYPERYYKDVYVLIPLKWAEKFIIDDTPREIREKISGILKNLILKKRIQRVIPRVVNGGGSEDDGELNDIEIQQQLWTIIVRQN